MKRLLFLVALCGILAAFVAVSAASSVQVAGASTGDRAAATISAASGADYAMMLTPVEQSVLTLTNEDRTQQGLPPVEFDPALLATARQRAAEQLSPYPLSHVDSTGQLIFVRMLAQDQVPYVLAGENLARARDAAHAQPEVIVDAWMQSPAHRRNILEDQFNRLAVGMASDASGRVAFAQIFRDY